MKVGKNTINVEVTAQDDTTKQTYSIVLTRAGNNDDQAPSPGNEPAGTEEEQEQVKPITPTDDKLVTQSKVSTTIEKDENGTDITVVKLVQEVFKQQLADNKEAKAFVLPVQPSSNGKARATLQVRDVEDAANNNNENVFIIKTDGAEYSLPASIVNSLDAAKGLGIDEVNAADAEVQVTIEEKPASVMNENSGQLASKIVDFSIKVTNGESSYTLNNFGSTYVNRTFDLTEDVSASKLVGVVVNADGSIAPVPTEFVTIDGKKVAVLKRNSNSMYTVISNDASFTDIDQHWAEEAIELLGDKLIVNGYQDDSFKPQGTITRGEFATIIARSLGLDTSDTHIQQFSDVASSDWYAGALKAVVDLNLVYGYEDGTFKPNAEITRQDAAVILGRVIEFLKLQNNQDPQSEDFTDQHAISDYAVQSVTLAANMSIINGYEDQSFKPQSFIKRAEAVMMIKKLLEQANFISQ